MLSMVDWLQRVVSSREYRKSPKMSDIRQTAVIILKFEQDGFTIQLCVQKMQLEWQTVKTLAYTVFPDPRPRPSFSKP